ncbi:DEGP1 [Symbiodinium natans]|uniref:DEGP1 protein n=1 Tax=Symbiodinium natans TaxID=878477 RepID=A0A812SVG3_9DINO|nr:DEGP1 [Symbiodinium natans]
MQPLSRGASADLKPGQEVFALGNPFGLEHSMSKGVISGVARSMEGTAGWPMSGIIQTDASINPGNSGGPLLNSEGSVVGVNTAILSTSGTFSGVGFALPIDTVQKNVASMIEEGYVTRPSIGVELAPDEVLAQLLLGVWGF